MWGIKWDWHFCWWPAKSMLCEGWLNHQTPSGKTKDKQRNHTRLSTSVYSPEPGSYTQIQGSKMKVSSASTAIGWCHTVRTQVGLLEPLPSLTSPKHTKLMEGVDHRITHLHRSFQLQFRGCGGSLRPSSPGSRGRRGGSASRHPRCPSWPPDGCPCLGTWTQPLGSCWKGHGSLTGLPR